jgi:tetrahydromethanopterin S-methyltransferase subunit C
VSYNARRIIALAVVLLASTLGGLLTLSFFGSRVAPVIGVVVGAVVGVVLVVIWASRSS